MSWNILIQHQLKVVVAANEEDFQKIHVKQKTLYADALRAFLHSSFNLSRMLKITFIVEAVINDGGPQYFAAKRRDLYLERKIFVWERAGRESALYVALLIRDKEAPVSSSIGKVALFTCTVITMGLDQEGKVNRVVRVGCGSSSKL